MTGQVALGPLIDERQRDRVHSMVTDSVAAGATLRGRRHLRGALLPARPCCPTCPTSAPAYAEEVFGPVAPVVSLLARSTRRSRSPRPPLRPLAGHPVAATACARSSWPAASPPGAIHINDQTVADEAVIPFGGTGHLGQRLAHGRPGQPRGLHRDPVGHGAERDARLPVLEAVQVDVVARENGRRPRACEPPGAAARAGRRSRSRRRSSGAASGSCSWRTPRRARRARGTCPSTRPGVDRRARR